jgi:melibiose permease/lactose/raffinose/galactose permease
LAQFSTLSILIGVLGRIWDGINDPMMGAIIEGSHLKSGKYKPWILIGAILCGIATVVLFTVRPTGWNFVAFIVVMYLVWETVFTINDIGYWSMIPSLSKTTSQRNSLTTMTIFFAGVGGLLMQGIISYLSPGNILDGYTAFAIAAGCAIIITQTLTVLGVKEAPRPPKEQERKISFRNMFQTLIHNDQLLWMSLAMIFYNIGSGLLGAFAYNLYYLEVGYDGNIFFFIVFFGVGSMIIQLFYPWIAKRLGRRRLQKTSAIMAIFGYLGCALIGWFAFLPFNLWTFSFFGLFIFIGQSLLYISSIVHMTNCVEYNEIKTGRREEAVISTMRPLIVKFGDALKYGIVTVVLAISGVFALSQNVSSLETQVNYFTKIEATETMSIDDQQAQYLVAVKQLSLLVENDPEDEDALADIQEWLDGDAFMFPFQIEAKDLPMLADLHVFYGEDHLGTIGSLSEGQLLAWTLMEEGAFSLSIRGEYPVGAESVSYNVADEYFNQQAGIETRILLRFAVTVLPALLVYGAWMVQRKKYIIDERYFDSMVQKLERKNRKTVAGE